MKKVTKLLAKVILLAILATVAFNFAGCVSINKYYINQEKDWPEEISSTNFKIESKVNSFDVEDVNLEMHIGLHKLSFLGKMDDYPRGQHAFGYASNLVSMDFAVYICEGLYEWDFPEASLNVTDIANHLFVREIKDKEAFSKEYGYTLFRINHKENIKIPQEYFENDEGSVIIKLVTWISYDYDDNYFACVTARVILEYERIGDTVTITNFNER